MCKTKIAKNAKYRELMLGLHKENEFLYTKRKLLMVVRIPFIRERPLQCPFMLK